jgi:hypothetical protein
MYPHFENKWIRHTAHISLCQYDVVNFALGDKYPTTGVGPVHCQFSTGHTSLWKLYFSMHISHILLYERLYQ